MADAPLAVEIEPIQVAPIPEADKIEGVLRPSGYRILVRILTPEETMRRWSDAGLGMPEEIRDREMAAQLWAEVIELGPDAYRDEKRFPNGPWCKAGEVIMMRPYSGTRFMVRGVLYALINDDTVQGVVFKLGELERV